MSTEPQQGDPQKMDINALQYALDYWRKYLKEHLGSAIVATFAKMYDRAIKAYDKKKAPSPARAWQDELQRVPEFVQGQLGSLAQEVSSFFDPTFNLKKSIKTIFVHTTMIAGSIRPASKANQRFDVQLPTPESFIHRIMSISAVGLFQWPSLFDRSPKTNTEKERLVKFKEVNEVVRDSIDRAITQLMPYAELQDVYLSDTTPPQGQPVPPPVTVAPQPVIEEVKQPEPKQPEQAPPEDPELKAGFKASSSKGKASSSKIQEEDDEEDDSGSGSGSESGSGSDDDSASQAGEQTDEEPQPESPKKKKRSPPEPPKKSGSSKKPRKF
jgi:hypothetical protein